MGVITELYPRPVSRFIPSEGLWELLEDYECYVQHQKIVIPAGFLYKPSVPRLAYLLIIPAELSETAGLIHDWLYKHKGRPPGTTLSLSRSACDRIFLDVMQWEEVTPWKARAAYVAVRFFGWFRWVL